MQETVLYISKTTTFKRNNTVEITSFVIRSLLEYIVCTFFLRYTFFLLQSNHGR